MESAAGDDSDARTDADRGERQSLEAEISQQVSDVFEFTQRDLTCIHAQLQRLIQDNLATELAGVARSTSKLLSRFRADANNELDKSTAALVQPLQQEVERLRDDCDRLLKKAAVRGGQATSSHYNQDSDCGGVVLSGIDNDGVHRTSFLRTTGIESLEGMSPLDGEVASLRNELETLREEHQSTATALEEARGELAVASSAASTVKEALQNETDNWQKGLVELVTNRRREQAQLASMFESQVDQLKRDFEEVRGSSEMARSGVNDLKARVEAALMEQFEASTKELHSSLEENQRATGDLRANVEDNQRSVRELKCYVEETQESQRQLVFELRGASNGLGSRLNSLTEDVDGRLEALNTRVASLVDDVLAGYDALDARHSALGTRNDKYTEDLQAHGSRLEQLGSNLQRLEEQCIEGLEQAAEDMQRLDAECKEVAAQIPPSPAQIPPSPPSGGRRHGNGMELQSPDSEGGQHLALAALAAADKRLAEAHPVAAFMGPRPRRRVLRPARSARPSPTAHDGRSASLSRLH